MEANMAKTHQIVSINTFLLVFPLCLAALIGCGDDVTEITNVTNEVTGMEQVNKYSKLPKCTSENFGRIFYVSDSAKVFYCNEKKWLTLNGSDGKDGINGKDGISVKNDSLKNFSMSGIDSNELEITLVNYGRSIDGIGVCSEKRNKEVVAKDSKYFFCDKSTWRTATPLEYDTYKWADSSDGAQKVGNVSKILYIYDYDRWRAAVGVEKKLGACVKKNDSDVKKCDDTYYICDQRLWRTASQIEYDMYGKACMQDATIDSGVVHPYNKYVCDGGKFRLAKPLEVIANLGCTSYNNGASLKIQNSNYICDKDSTFKGMLNRKINGNTEVYDRDSSGWSFDFNHLVTDRFVDPRDGQSYNTIGIKSQVWMAENLRYVSANSKCQWAMSLEDSTYCDTHGRLYLWKDAKSACPKGWRLPDSLDFWILNKTTKGFNNSLINGSSNVYGFSAIGTYFGYRQDYYVISSYATDGFTPIDSTLITEIYYTVADYGKEFANVMRYWSSTTGSVSEEVCKGSECTKKAVNAVYVASLENNSYLSIGYCDRDYSALSIRCIKDSE